MKPVSQQINTFLLTLFLAVTSNAQGQKQLHIYSTISPYGLAINKKNVDYEKFGKESNRYITSQYFSLGISELYKENVIFGIEASLQKTSFNGYKNNPLPIELPNEFEWISSEYKLTNVSSRLGIQLYYIFLTEKKLQPLFGGGFHLGKDRLWIEKGTQTYKNFASAELRTETYEITSEWSRIRAFYSLRFGGIYAINSKLSCIIALELSAGLIRNTFPVNYNQERKNKFELATPITLSYNF